MRFRADHKPFLVASFLILQTCAAASLGSRVSAQDKGPSSSSRIDELFKHLVDHNRFMGSVAVSKAGKIIFSQQYGHHLPNASSDQKPNAETQYRIGSITKTFTATMIMQLVEEGKLSLDTKISKFFPGVANADEISIRQLLGHRSGIGSITSDPTYLEWNTEEQSRQQMMEIIRRQPTKFEPGERAEYSNSNFVLLGFIVEDLTGSSYAQQLKLRICDRAGLNRTAYMTMSDAEANVARSFRRAGKVWEPHEQTHPSIPHGAGAIMSTPTDLVRFAEALFGGKLISEGSLKEMMPEGMGMGNGLFAFPFGAKRALGHNGGIDSFQSNLGYFPEDDLAVAMVTNGIDYQMNNLLIGVLSLAFDQPYKLPEFAVKVKVGEDVLKRYVGVYSRENFPLKITITVADGSLVAQGSGQPSFALTATGETEFQSDAVGAALSFSKSSPDGDYDTMQLKQGPANLEFAKE